MTGLNHEQHGDNRVFYSAKMLVALELRRTHGIVFAAAFLNQFAPKVCRAAVNLALRRGTTIAVFLPNDLPAYGALGYVSRAR